MKNSKYVGVGKIYMCVYAHKRIKNETNNFHVTKTCHPYTALVTYVTTTCRTRKIASRNTLETKKT